MATSIQISEDLQKELIKRKFSDKETYEEVIWDMVEDSRELSEETKKEISLGDMGPLIALLACYTHIVRYSDICQAFKINSDVFCGYPEQCRLQ